MRSKSFIWKLYKKVNADVAECTLCMERLSTAGRSSSGLIRHAKSFHEAELNLAKDHSEDVALNDSSILTLLSLSFATGAVSFSFIENLFFKKFLEKVGVHTISAASIKKKILEMAESSRSVVEDMIGKKENLTITFDGWTSLKCNFSAYCLFTIHIDSNFRRQIMMIGCKALPGSATSENVGSLLASMLETVNLTLDNAKYAVTDSGSNLLKLARNVNLTRTPCVCHSLANFFKDVFKCSQLDNVFKKATSVASLLKKSSPLKEKFFKFSKIIKNDVKIPHSFSPTRWGGSFLLLRDFMESVPVLISVPELAAFIPSAEEGTVASCAVELMDEIFKCMTQMESDSSTASSIIPNLVALDAFLTNHENASTPIGKIIRSFFKKRIVDIINDSDLLLFSFTKRF